MAKHRKFKTTKAILRHTLDYFEANKANWTVGTLRRKNKDADHGVAFCALGGIGHFAEKRGQSQTAQRYLAEAMGMKYAHSLPIEEVQRFIYHRNDGADGKERILKGLKAAIA